MLTIPTRSTAATASIAALVLFTAVACGGSGGKTISKADYLRKGDAICGATNKALRAQRANTDFNDPAAQSQFIRNSIAAVGSDITKVQALGYPSGDETELSGWYNDLKGVLSAMLANPGELTSALSDRFTAATKGLRAYGFTQCGQINP